MSPLLIITQQDMIKKENKTKAVKYALLETFTF